MPRPQKNRQFRKLYIGPWLARLGKKPVDAAKAIGVTETYMSELISGKKKNPGHAILFDLSEWLGIPMNALYRMPPAQNAVDAVEGMTAAEMAALGTLLDKVNRGTKKAG